MTISKVKYKLGRRKITKKLENSSRMYFLIPILSSADNGRGLIHLFYVSKQEDSLTSS
jgi:hypothetical protein